MTSSTRLNIPGLSSDNVSTSSPSRPGSSLRSAGSMSRSSSLSDRINTPDTDSVDTQSAARMAAMLFERFDRMELQELMAHRHSHFYLSTEDIKLAVDQPSGLATHMYPFSENSCVLLFPEQAEVLPLDFREIHQIIRELVLGIFALNQEPKISLETNYDSSISIQLPPAYYNTRVGQLLINVDYEMKSLWHGSHFPKERRTKFLDRWRNTLDTETEEPSSLLSEFITAGMVDPSIESEYSGIYDTNQGTENPFYIDLFMKHVDNLSMELTLCQNSIQQYQNMFVIDPFYSVSSKVKMTEDGIRMTDYDIVQSRLQKQAEILQSFISRKRSIRRQLGQLMFISFMVPLLGGLKKRMKIPDLHRLLPNMTSDETRTEREFPPLMKGPDFKCQHFAYKSGDYFNLHGSICIDIGNSGVDQPSGSILGQYEALHSEALRHLDTILEPEASYVDSYPIPVIEINNKRYHVIAIELETYYPQTPLKPFWLEAVANEATKVISKRPTVKDDEIKEFLKRKFGFRNAMKYLNPHFGLRVCAEKGLVSLFDHFAGKLPVSRLSKQDELGLSLLHHAAIHNKPNIAMYLLNLGVDVNVRKNQHITPAGPTALHLSCRCGALDVVACLLSARADNYLTDSDGMAPIHLASYFDHVQIIRHLVRKDKTLLDLYTGNKLRTTPLLLAASSGAIESLKCLLSLGGDITKHDKNSNNCVHLATFSYHCNILEYLITINHPDMSVWKLLIGMLESGDKVREDCAVRCLEQLSVSNKTYWKSIYEAGGVPALVSLLVSKDDSIKTQATSVICNISEHDEVRTALAESHNSTTTLIGLLGSGIADIQSRVAIILADIAHLHYMKTTLAEEGAVEALVHQLNGNIEDVLVNTVNAINQMCLDCTQNQNLFTQHNCMKPLVEFLACNSDILKASASSAIAAICHDNVDNQMRMLNEGGVLPLIDLMKIRNIAVQVKVASALEALTVNNTDTQSYVLSMDAPKALIKLLKVWSIEVKEQGACTLWALAGQATQQQKTIAERITIPQIIDMLLLQSEKLQYVGCSAVIALARADVEYQQKIAMECGIPPLVRLLRSSRISDRVRLTVITTLGVLCVGVAHRNNPLTQDKIAEENAITPLVEYLMSRAHSDVLRVEAGFALSNITLGNPDNQKLLKEQKHFSFNLLLKLLKSDNMDVRLKAGLALATFAFNNPSQQFAIREAGGIRMHAFTPFLQSDNEAYQASAAFQVTVLARVIRDTDQVSLTAMSVNLLTKLLKSDKDDSKIQSAGFISSLAHTRAGIPEGFVTTGAVFMCTDNLSSFNHQVRGSAAVALGYLTFNRTAARQLLVACRSKPGLYSTLISNLGKDAKICKDFTDEYRIAEIVGLPSHHLECNGGPPVITNVKNKMELGRPKVGRLRFTSGAKIRTSSAPLPRPDYVLGPEKESRTRCRSAYPTGTRVKGSSHRETTGQTVVGILKNKPDSDDGNIRRNSVEFS